MSDRLFLLEPGFSDPDLPGGSFVCPHSNAIEGLLAAFPERAAAIEIERLPFSRPRRRVAELIGPERQSLPVLVFDGPPSRPDGVEHRRGVYFTASGPAILAHLAERHGFPRLHP